LGDRNQRLYLEARAEHFVRPHLEVGSRDHGSDQDLRGLFGEPPDYVGIDMQEGPGVDLVLDLSVDFASIDAALGGRRFASIFCLSVLEHCARPFEMAANLTRLLAPAGALCVGVPFAWKFHGYPSDYWRFTHEGVKQLFPDLGFDPADTVLASERENHFLPVDAELGRIPLSFGSWRRRGRPLRGLAAALLRRALGVRYLLAPTHLIMLGRR
jgi:hypothetical protein